MEMGIWIESDNYIPTPGDWILFEWAASSGENLSAPDHIGTSITVMANRSWI